MKGSGEVFALLVYHSDKLCCGEEGTGVTHLSLCSVVVALWGDCHLTGAVSRW